MHAEKSDFKEAQCGGQAEAERKVAIIVSLP